MLPYVCDIIQINKKKANFSVKSNFSKFDEPKNMFFSFLFLSILKTLSDF